MGFFTLFLLIGVLAIGIILGFLATAHEYQKESEYWDSHRERLADTVSFDELETKPATAPLVEIEDYEEIGASHEIAGDYLLQSYFERQLREDVLAEIRAKNVARWEQEAIEHEE